MKINKTNQVSFKSTYSASLRGVDKEGKDILRKLTKEHNGIFPRSNEGDLRLSVDIELDSVIEKTFTHVGVKKASKVDYHDLPKKLLDNALSGNGEGQKPVKTKYFA